ncbi:gag-pol polyprotein [Tanacetum coccineum]
MSTSNVHQQSLADASSETRPPMLERGPYEFRIFTPSETEAPRLQKEEDLRGDDLKHYEAEIEAMNLIIISIPNDIYNYVDACTAAKSIWQRVERLVRGTVQNQVDRETRFNNEFNQFVAEPGEALVSVYNHFAQLMNDLEQNHIKFPPVTVNTKFLNCLQPEWLKYVTQVRLVKRLTGDSYNDLFDYLQQFEKLVNASRAKNLEKSHDHLALVAHTGSSSRISSPYYVTHPSSVVDYDDDYQGDTVQNNSKDPLTSAMILLACAITQNFSNPTNNRLCTSSNTRNQSIVQGDRVNIQSKNYGDDGRNIRRSYVQEEVIKSNNVHNDAGNMQRTLRTASSGTVANVQCYNYSEKGHYARNCPKPRIRDLNYFMEQMLLAKQDEAEVILTNKQNDFLFADASWMEEIEELSANICLMAKIQPANIDPDVWTSYDFAFLNLEQQRDKLDLNVVESKKQSVELQKTQLILKHKMSEREDKYHDTVLDLEAKIQMNVRDTEDILEDATKGQTKMKDKMKDPIVIQKKQNVCTIDYNKLNDLYEDFVPQKELSAEQKYFPPSFISPEDPTNERLSATSSVRRPSNRDSSFKNSVVSNTKNLSKTVEVSDRTNKKQDVAFKNVGLDTFVTNDEIKNALIAKNVLCVSCAKNLLFPCHDNCLAKYKLNAHSNVRRALFTTPRTVKSTFKDTTPVVSKTSSNTEKITFCSACEWGKSKKASHPSKLVPSSDSKLELLHMDLCGPIRVASINGKKYILVIVDDYSRFTWVYFLRSKGEIPKIIKKFIAQVQLNYDTKIHKIRTDNGIEFKNATLKAHYEKLGIMQQFSTTRTPQQNGVVERRNRTLVEAACIMLIFSLLPEFL